MTVTVNMTPVATFAEAVDLMRAAEAGTDELGKLLLGEEFHGPTLRDELMSVRDPNLLALRDRVLRLALPGDETKDALRTRPASFYDPDDFAFETPPTFAASGTAQRDAARDRAATRIAYWEGAIAEVIERMFERQMQVVVARLRGKQGRKGTRHWDYGEKDVRPDELKAINPLDVIDKERWARETGQDVEALLERLWVRQAEDTAGDLGLSFDAESLFNSEYIRNRVAEKVRQVAATTEHRAEQIMKVILDADASGDDIDDIVDKVIGTYDQRRVWAQAPAHVLAAATVNEASLDAAARLGVTYKQWLSSRDDRVRFTHRGAGGGDGQVVPIHAPFIIGGVPLMFPGDPSGLPVTGQQVYGCRCVMLFALAGKPDPERFTPLEDLPGARPPIYDAADDNVRASLVAPKFTNADARVRLAQWLGLTPDGLEAAFRRRGWRPSAVGTLTRLTLLWLALKALGDGGTGDLLDVAASLGNELVAAGVSETQAAAIRDTMVSAAGTEPADETETTDDVRT